MKPILFLIAVAIVAALTLGPAIVDGQRRFRWGEDDEVAGLAEQIRSFPKQLGDWQVNTDDTLDRESLRQLTPVEYMTRTYVSPNQGKQVQVVLLLGPTGPIAAHTPDICFNSREYQKIGDREAIPVDPDRPQGSHCYRTKFQSRNVDSGWLVSWYAWTIDGKWAASANPRFEFARSRYLLKIQVVARYPDRETMEQDTDTPEFLQDLEETLQNHVMHTGN